MRRRDFVAGLGSAATWPLVARAQQGGRMRRIGVLLGVAADDPESPMRLAAFLQELQEVGWTVGRTCGSTIGGAIATAFECFTVHGRVTV